jgi:transcriptional regulator with XRE-family HTH domain
MNIGEKIKRFRKEHLLTLREAAKVFDVSAAEISRLENCKNEPHFITVARWEKKLIEAEGALK